MKHSKSKRKWLEKGKGVPVTFQRDNRKRQGVPTRILEDRFLFRLIKLNLFLN